MSASGARNDADPFKLFLGPETDNMCQFLCPEIVKMGQQSFLPQKPTLWVSSWAQKLTLWPRDTISCIDTSAGKAHR